MSVDIYTRKGDGTKKEPLHKRLLNVVKNNVQNVGKITTGIVNNVSNNVSNNTGIKPGINKGVNTIKYHLQNVGKFATNATKAASETAKNSIQKIGNNAVNTASQFHKQVTKPMLDTLNPLKPTIGAGKITGGVLETLIYGEENNSPQFYKPNNTKTILVVILFLLLTIILIVMYYYSTCKNEPFSVKNLIMKSKFFGLK
jgi:uncharacterized protein YwbE